MTDPSPFGRPQFRGFQRSFVGRAPGPLGCLVALVACPIGIVIALVMFVVSLFGTGRRRGAASAWRPATPEAAAREEALRRLVRAMALDDTFSADDARQAGTLATGGATVDDLIAEALERRWIEVRGERLAVTRRGREETQTPPIG